MGVPAKIDFGWIKQAWTLFAAQSSVWIGAVGLYFVINLTIWVLLLAISMGGLTLFQRAFSYGMTRSPSYSSPAPTPRVYKGLAKRQMRDLLLAGVDAILVGGLYRMALRQRRGEAISVFGLFSARSQSLPLFLVGLVVPVIIGVIEGVGVWPLHRFLPHQSSLVTSNVYLGLSILLSGPLMFVPLLIVDVNATAAEAVVGGVRLLQGQLLRGIWFYVVTSLVAGVGAILCGIGMLATYPVFLLTIAIAYLALSPPVASLSDVAPAPAGVWPPPPRVL